MHLWSPFGAQRSTDCWILELEVWDLHYTVSLRNQELCLATGTPLLEDSNGQPEAREEFVTYCRRKRIEICVTDQQIFARMNTFDCFQTMVILFLLELLCWEHNIVLAHLWTRCFARFTNQTLLRKHFLRPCSFWDLVHVATGLCKPIGCRCCRHGSALLRSMFR